LVLYFSFFWYIILASAISSIDQLVTTSVTPFLVLCTALATIFISIPGVIIPIYLIGYFIFWNSISITQKYPQAMLSAQVNGLSAIGLGITVSIILYLNHKARMVQDSIILSQKKKLQSKNSELISLNKAKSDFLSMAAHDLKNPLNVIQGMSALLLESDTLSVSSHEKVYMIMQNTRRMLHLITELLNINQIESKKVNVMWEVCDLNTIVNDTINSLKPLVNRKQQNLVVELSSERLILRVDRFYLMEIIENLISNAIKYSEYNKSIYIKTYKEVQSVHLEIRDEGQGINSEEQKKLFSKFSKLSSRPTGGESSTGLGLFIVKKLTDAMNGKIICNSAQGGKHIYPFLSA
jgi:signal transduction histidine kinase